MQADPLRNKRLLEAAFKFWAENVISDDFDDAIGSFAADELMSSAVHEFGSKKRKGGGSVVGKAGNIDRDRQEGARKLFNDYFSVTPVYDHVAFRRRYRMSQTLFTKVHNAVVNSNPYFHQKKDALGVLGCTALQKTTASMHQLSYNVPPDALDENLRVSKTVANVSLFKFAAAEVK